MIRSCLGGATKMFFDAQHIKHIADASLQHTIRPAEVEAVGEAEQQEAWHRHLSTDVDGQRLVEVYRKLYLQWLQHPMAPCTAYIQRACMHLQAKCYLQVYYSLAASAVMPALRRSVLMFRLLLPAGECVLCCVTVLSNQLGILMAGTDCRMCNVHTWTSMMVACAAGKMGCSAGSQPVGYPSQGALFEAPLSLLASTASVPLCLSTAHLRLFYHV